MSFMFWVWLGVIIVTALIEFFTMELVSIWFTVGAVLPFILSAFSVPWEVQVTIFIIVSIVCIFALRGVTKKFLLKNSNGKTNMELIIGRQYRMLERTDFETMGSLKIGDVVWSAVGERQQAIEKDEIVEVVRVEGNKLIVKSVSAANNPNKEEI